MEKKIIQIGGSAKVNQGLLFAIKKKYILFFF